MSRAGDEIKRLRDKKNLTLAQLYEKCGVAPGSLSPIETGKQTGVTVSTIKRLAKGLGINPVHLFKLFLEDADNEMERGA